MHTFIKAAMAGLLAAGLAGCSTASPTETASLSPEQVLTDAWEKDDMNDVLYVMGGYGDTAVENEPAALDLDADLIETVFHIPAETVKEATSAASLMNGMMPNYLTVIVMEMPEDSIGQAVEKTEVSLKDAKWLDAQPDSFYIVTDGSLMTVVYGIDSQTEPFVKALMEVLPDAATVSGSLL